MKTNIRFFMIGAIATIVAIVLIMLYNNQNRVVFKKKFYIPLPQNADIICSYDYNGEDCSYSFALKTSDNYYENTILKMKKVGYYVADEELCDLLLFNNDRLPTERIEEVYVLDTVKYGFNSTKRIHIYAYITKSVDGFRQIYFDRYG